MIRRYISPRVPRRRCGPGRRRVVGLHELHRGLHVGVRAAAPVPPVVPVDGRAPVPLVPRARLLRVHRQLVPRLRQGRAALPALLRERPAALRGGDGRRRRRWTRALARRRRHARRCLVTTAGVSTAGVSRRHLQLIVGVLRRPLQ